MPNSKIFNPIITASELQQIRLDLPKSQKVGFVPTMGALHDGHLELVKQAREQCDVIVSSIFVNPKQFVKGEDFSTYPRQIDADMSLLEAQGVDIIFTPNAAEIYGDRFTSYVSSALENELCGAYRPGHFAGVLTVVMKLFQLVKPHKAFFGKKDYQQYVLIKNMVGDFNLDCQIIGVNTVRENDGLAMSSRNKYLDETQRSQASILYAAMQEAHKIYQEAQPSEAIYQAFDNKLKETPEFKLQYRELRNAETLLPLSYEKSESVVLLAAGFLGRTRLIDNLEFSQDVK